MLGVVASSVTGADPGGSTISPRAFLIWLVADSPQKRIGDSANTPPLMNGPSFQEKKMPALPVRTAVCGILTALVFGGAGCGLRTTLEAEPGTGPDARTAGPVADASPLGTGGSSGFGLPDAAAVTTPDVATDTQIFVNGPDVGPVRSPDAFSIPTRPDGSTAPAPTPDASALGGRDSGFTPPDTARPVPTRDAGTILGRDAGFTIPGFGNDAGFTFPTRPDGGFTIPGFGNDGGFTIPGFGNDGGFTIPTQPGAGGTGTGNGGGFGGGTNGGGTGRGNGGAGRGNGG